MLKSFLIFSLIILNNQYLSAQTLNNKNSNQFSKINEDYLNKVVSAIYVIEGGNKTKYPFGIKSINTGGDYIKAKKICENTVKNNYIRWQKAGSKGNYLDFLADRYCPPSADPQGNINWKKNIKRMVVDNSGVIK